uniref:Uncharacterized protein n=1 Tax=Romanomermis culicivorax TaxID=13658 RepID=A0A915JPZ6_ROMCU
MKTLTGTTHLELLTALKALKKKKKQKDKWNKSSDVSDKEDPSLQPKKLYDDSKRLQAAVALAMKSGLMLRLIKLLSFLISPFYNPRPPQFRK